MKYAFKAMDTNPKGVFMDPQRPGILSQDEFMFAVKNVLKYPDLDGARSVFGILDKDGNKSLGEKEFSWLEDFNGNEFLKELDRLKKWFETEFGDLEKAWEMIDRMTPDQNGVESDDFARLCKRRGFRSKYDVRLLFNFLDDSTGGKASGLLCKSEWMLLRCFDSAAVAGCPARLRKMIKDELKLSYDDVFNRARERWAPIEARRRIEMFVPERLPAMRNEVLRAKEESSPAGKRRLQQQQTLALQSTQSTASGTGTGSTSLFGGALSMTSTAQTAQSLGAPTPRSARELFGQLGAPPMYDATRRMQNWMPKAMPPKLDVLMALMAAGKDAAAKKGGQQDGQSPRKSAGGAAALVAGGKQAIANRA